MAAIGIGAMIVFIALILVAAVAAAVIIQTAEKLQQNAQTTGDDTADNMAGKLLINTAYVDPGTAGDNYLLFVSLAPGSEITAFTSVSFQLFCDNGVVEGDSVGEMTYTRMDGSAVAELNPGVAYQLILDASGGDDCRLTLCSLTTERPTCTSTLPTAVRPSRRSTLTTTLRVPSLFDPSKASLR